MEPVIRPCWSKTHIADGSGWVIHLDAMFWDVTNFLGLGRQVSLVLFDVYPNDLSRR